MADKIATRQAYGEALIELVEKNDKVVVLDADLANATQTCKVAKAHPEKYPHLIVRVWGWSGYFVELDECYQDHVIRRIEFAL